MAGEIEKGRIKALQCERDRMMSSVLRRMASQSCIQKMRASTHAMGLASLPNLQGDTNVCSWDDFSPLRHVIVGNAAGACAAATDVRGDGPGGRKPADMIEEAEELLDNYAAVLRAEGIRVDRCDNIDWHNELKTPLWSQPNEVGTMPPRDTFLTIGSEILECPLVLSQSPSLDLRSNIVHGMPSNVTSNPNSSVH